MADRKPVVAVVGGAGYIGSHACKALARAGFTPLVLDNFSYGHRWAVRWGPSETVDIADRAALTAAFRAHRPVGVMHFAGLISVGESVRDPLLYYANNVGGTLNVIAAMRDCGLDIIVFSSTAAVYQTARDGALLGEDSPLGPQSPYGRSKLAVESVLADCAAAYGIRAVSLRYFNAAGADPDGETGESHDPETHLIPLALQAAMGRRPRLDIFGDDYPTPDGTAIRDYIHVSDLAGAHVLALSYLLDGGPSAVLNLGTGSGHSVREIVAAIGRVTGCSVPVAMAPRRDGDVAHLVADPTRARTVLNFRTPMSDDIDNIVRTAWQWAKTAPG